MNPSFSLTIKKIDNLDKFLIICVSLIPLSLAISIFFADLLASICSLVLIYFFLTKKNLNIFKIIKTEIIFFILLYSIILISLILTNYKDQSFLPSFFYFRYFLLSLSIFYLLKKYNIFFQIFFYSVFVSIGIVVIDSFIQHFFDVNTLGYIKVGSSGTNKIIHLTSFFNEEKKLGSYLVRFLPLLLSLIYLNKPKISVYLEILILFLIGTIVFLSSERTGLFLLFIIYFFYFLIANNKKTFLILIFLIFSILFNLDSSSRLSDKYINFTLKQIGLYNHLVDSDYEKKNKNDIVRYYSEEHENLFFTGIEIFKKNIFFGSGIKSFYSECNNLKEQNIIKSTKRNNKLTCSTHPHNTHVQILSEIGIFGFFLILFLFFKVLKNTFLILYKKEKSNFYKSYYFINLSIIVNLMPLIPSGSFFNNWLSLMMFFSLGFWIYIRNKSN